MKRRVCVCMCVCVCARARACVCLENVATDMFRGLIALSLCCAVLCGVAVLVACRAAGG